MQVHLLGKYFQAQQTQQQQKMVKNNSETRQKIHKSQTYFMILCFFFSYLSKIQCSLEHLAKVENGYTWFLLQIPVLYKNCLCLNKEGNTLIIIGVTNNYKPFVMRRQNNGCTKGNGIQQKIGSNS